MTDEQRHEGGGPATSGRPEAPTPWRQMPAHAPSPEGRIAELFARMPPAEVSPERLVRMRARLAAAVEPRRRGRRRPWIFAPVAAVLLLASGVGVAEVGWAPRWMPSFTGWRALLPRRGPAPPAVDRAAPARRPAPARKGSAPPAEDAWPGAGAAGSPIAPPAPAAVLPEPSPGPAAAPHPVRTRLAMRDIARPLPRSAAEAAVLESVLVRLRRHRDAAGALTALDEYEASFPNGRLRGEALRLRVDALLLADRRDDALACLRRLPLTPGARDLELAVIRGELLASRGACREATADFDRVLAQAPTALMDRALAGRRACAQRLATPGAAP